MLKSGSPWVLPESAPPSLHKLPYKASLIQGKETQPAEPKLPTKHTESAAQCQAQLAGQKAEGKQAKQAAPFKWVGGFWKAP